MKSKQYKDFLEVFQNEHIKLPTLKFGTSYSWATFEIVFSSKEDYEISKQKGLQDLFKTRIKRYYNPEFNPDLSVYYKYIGQIPIWMTLMNEDRMKDEQTG
jgi:hypothetical protein